MTFVRGRARDRASVTACSWLRGKHQLELSATGRDLLLAQCKIRHALGAGVFSRFGSLVQCSRVGGRIMYLGAVSSGNASAICWRSTERQGRR
jgi:hypothetical protein